MEKKYLEIINNLDIGFFRREFKGKLLMHNQAINRLVGLDSSIDLTGSSAPAFLANPEEQTRYYNELLKNGYIRDYITKIKKVNGEIITIQINAHIIKENNNKPLTIEGTVADITEKYMLEEKLKESKQRLKKFINAATDGFVLFDSKLNYIDINKVTLQLLGMTREELIGKNILDIAPNLKETGRYDEYLDVIKTGKPFSTEDVIYNRLDGSLSSYLSVRAFKVGDDLGIIFTDITERKKAEEMLKEAELRYRTTFEQSPDGIMIIDPETTRAIEFNDAMCNLLGYTREEFAKLKVPDYDATENPSDTKTHVEKVLKEGRDDFETKVRNKEGDIKDIFTTAKVIELSGKLYLQSICRDITERKKNEIALRKSEHKFRSLFENMLDGFAFCKIILDDDNNPVDFIYLEVNDAFERLTGLKKEEIIGRRVSEVIPDIKNSKPNLFEIFGKVALTGENTKFEIFFEPLKIWLLISVYSPEKNYFVAVFDNITKRKEKEEELRLHSEIMENMNEGVDLIRASDLLIAYANPRFEEMFGYNPGEIIGKHASIINAPTDKTPEDAAEDIVAVMEDTGEWHGEIQNIKKDGTRLWCYANISSFNHPEYGKVFVSILTDINEHKKAEQRLKESEEKYRSLYNNAEVGLFQTKVSDGRMLASNQKCAEMLGYGDIDQFLKNYIVAEHYVDPTVRTTMINKIKEEGYVKNYEAEVTDRYGIPHWWSFSARLYPDQNMIEGLLIDISERKEAEQKLKESEHKLTERIKELTTLYELSKLVETLDISLEDLILGTINIIPPAYQFPDITTARIIYKNRVYSLENFKETKWKMSIKMMIMKFPILIEVCYLENKSFLSEEYDLLVEIGTQLKRILDGREIQRKLKESEETYRLLFESSTDGIASADMEGNFIEINKAFLDLLGYSKEELLKLNFRDITPQKWHEMEDNLIIKQLSDEKDSGIYEKEYIQKDGTIIPIDIRFWIIKDVQEDPIRMWFIVRDITDRKIAEKEISDLAKFSSENPNPVLRATQYRILYANKSGIELLKVDIESNIPEFLHEIIQESLSKNIKQELDIELENQIYSFTISPIKAMGYVNIYGINITERIKAEEEIANLAKFPSEDPYPVLRVNLNNVLYINKAGQKLLKIDANDEIPEIFRAKVNEAFINNAITEVEVIFNSRIYSFNIIPIKESNYINIYGMDVTERKQVEQKLKEVNKLKSEFLRRASHELKTPLISIKGFSDLILSLYSDQLDMPIISKLKEINDGCERLQNIINNLLKTSRLESPDIRPKIQKEDLSFLIKFCLHELQSLAERRKQSINLDIHSELHTNIEKEEIHDVISNLVTNAIKYTPPRGKIDIKTELKEDFVVVSVKDNGIGFTEDQKKKIFQQFGKIERYGQGLDLGIDGTGLGLYISKRIVESHGGKIWMESEGRNKGSTFYFTIPTVK